MRARRLLIALSSLTFVACGLVGAPAASAATDTVTFNGIVELDGEGTTDISAGYPLDNCSWTRWNSRISGDVLTVVPDVSGTVTFALTRSTWYDKTIAVFDTSYSQLDCLQAMVVGSLSPFPAPIPTVTIPVLAGHEYVLLVWGCGGDCLVDADTYGEYVLSLTLDWADATPPPWMQAIGRDSAVASCPVGYNPSWAQWPNGGTGGYTCDKFVSATGNG
jgi:hypothetical protein